MIFTYSGCSELPNGVKADSLAFHLQSFLGTFHSHNWLQTPGMCVSDDLHPRCAQG